MNFMTTGLWAGLLAAGALPAQAQIPCPATLRVAFFDYELLPLVSADEPGKPVRGKAVDWIEQALADTGCRPRLRLLRLPIIRGREELSRNQIDVWAIAYPGPDIAAIGVLPMHAGQIDARLGYFKAAYSFYVTADATDVSWDGKTLISPSSITVGMAPIPALQAEAKNRGWPVELGRNTPNVLAKLLSGRSRVALLPDLLIDAQPPEVQRKVTRLTPPAYVSWYYAVGSHEMGQRHPEFMRQFWLGLCRAGRADQKEAAPCRE